MGDLRDRLLTSKPKLFFVDCIGDFSSLSKEIKVFSNRLLGCSSCWLTAAKCIVIEKIVFLI